MMMNNGLIAIQIKKVGDWLCEHADEMVADNFFFAERGFSINVVVDADHCEVTFNKELIALIK